MVDRAASLLAEILADPASDPARQVLADELITRGDPRGELVQIDFALAGPLSIRKRAALRARRAELVRDHGKAWWPFALATLVRRGFIEAASRTLAQILAAGDALFAAEPVVELAVNELGGSAGARELAHAAWMSRVRRLVVRGLDDDGFAALVAAPACQGLESLNVTANQLSGDAVASLADHLPACRTLVLTANDLGDDGIAGVRAWRHVTAVETLYLSECELSTEGVAALLAAPLPALSKLALNLNELGDDIAAVFAASAHHLPALRVLELKATGLSRAVLDGFQHSALALARLDLRRNTIRCGRLSACRIVRPLTGHAVRMPDARFFESNLGRRARYASVDRPRCPNAGRTVLRK
jgi:hypothetical protein